VRREIKKNLIFQKLFHGGFLFLKFFYLIKFTQLPFGDFGLPFGDFKLPFGDFKLPFGDFKLPFRNQGVKNIV
jgi:hypothetical protein